MNNPTELLAAFGINQLYEFVIGFVALVAFCFFIGKGVAAMLKGQNGKAEAKQNIIYSIVVVVALFIALPAADWIFGQLSDNRSRIENIPTQIEN